MVQERVGEPRAELEVIELQWFVRECSQRRPERLALGIRPDSEQRLETQGTE